MERLTIVIPGQFPSLNDYISSERRNRYAAAKVKRYQTERAAWYAGEAARKFGAKLPFAKPVIVGFHWFEPDSRRDVDNIVFAKKFVLDGPVMAGVLRDDSRRWVVGVRDHVSTDREHPGVEVQIFEMEED